ncbi:ATP synthase subunit e, mitochondrial [Chrysoperla carnea]|uniref:ATP synthase subunit e, mitochondrial n=1 Tax=Chrysoperla carnea TaxID=189513 RepID=UPI001D0610DE|nr:ATP synthase subunit e, mitochondrial [Chrysoperla carnea]
MSALPAPVNVHPVIKFGRWSLLIAGIIYGAANHSRFSRKEANLRAEEEKHRVAKEAKLAAEKEARAKQEIADLAALAGGKL